MYAAGSVLWRKDFGAEHALTTIKVDPTDWRHLCLCGAKGSIIVLRLVNLGRDRVEQQSYKVDMSSSKPGDTLRCCFSTTRDLLYVLLPREVSLSYGCSSFWVSLCLSSDTWTLLYVLPPWGPLMVRFQYSGTCCMCCCLSNEPF